MVARHGWKAVFGAVVAATGICLDLRFSAADPHLWQRWEDRLDRLDRLIPSTDAYSRSRFLAVIYPEVVGLATVIACPAWRKLATDGDPGRLQRFLAAAARCVGTSGWWAGDPTHPVVGWAQRPAGRAGHHLPRGRQPLPSPSRRAGRPGMRRRTANRPPVRQRPASALHLPHPAALRPPTPPHDPSRRPL
jgi:hypothetical protein